MRSGPGDDLLDEASLEVRRRLGDGLISSPSMLLSAWDLKIGLAVLFPK